MSTRTINPIKAALVTLLTEKKSELGLKSILRDISPQSMVDACKQELEAFPGVIVNYAGRTPRREGPTTGGTMVAAPTFALFVADRNASGPYVSGETSIDVIEDLVELLDGKRPSPLQKSGFVFTGDQLMYQDASLVIYQLLFQTETVHQRRF